MVAVISALLIPYTTERGFRGSHPEYPDPHRDSTQWCECFDPWKKTSSICSHLPNESRTPSNADRTKVMPTLKYRWASLITCAVSRRISPALVVQKMRGRKDGGF